jgi:hypothetical protein
LQHSNARSEPRPEAEAQRKLEGVGSSAGFGADAAACVHMGLAPPFWPRLLLLPTRGHQMGCLRHRESVGIDIRLDCCTDLLEQGCAGLVVYLRDHLRVKAVSD